ncbi:hypothetical protein FB157_108226 [Streptomyces sp. BK340]|nr:hypothetical protein FB157_108226 [Streptomyces sp. BK340]
MISKGRIGVRVRRLRAGYLSSVRARFHGRRDADGLQELLANAFAGSAPSDDNLPPYVLGLRAQVRHSTARLRSRTLKSHRALHVRIQSESVRVVTQYTERTEPTPAALARYGEWVGEWRSAASVCRAQAQQLADEANQLLACYWDAAWARARKGDQVGGQRPTGWLPGEITLDGTWARLDDGLLSDRWYGPQTPGRDADPSAVAQALHILDHQSARGRSGPARHGDASNGIRR